MDSPNNVMINFIAKLNEYISTLERKATETENVYNAHNYLMSNYNQGASAYERISSIPLDKVMEILYTFESNPIYTKTEIENALKFCRICETTPSYKEFERYKELNGILENINQIFTRHIFSNRNEININRVKNAQAQVKKFRDLRSFINGTITDYKLEPLESYYFEYANLADEEWLEVYFNLTMINIENYKRQEDELRETIKAKEEQRRAIMAKALEDKILSSIPKEDAIVLNPNGANPSITEEPEEEITEPVVEEKDADNGRPLSSNEEISQQLAILREKYKTYKYLGKITPTLRDSFEINLDFQNIDQSIEGIKIAYNTSTYHKFLFFCFFKKYETILRDVQESYTEDFDEYVKFILEDIKQALDFINRLEQELALEEQELAQANESELPQVEEVEKPYKLIFYNNNSTTSEIEKNLKSMTPEKIKDLVSLLSRIEEGRFENVGSLNKKTKTSFRLLVGQYVFVTFRILPNNHILVFTSSSLDELNNNSVDNRLAAYDLNYEKKVNSIIKDGTLEYRKLVKQSDDIHELVFSQVLGKGV